MEIAAALGLSPRTVESHRRDFAQRLDKAEQDELHEIQNQMSDVRRRLEGLISDYQRRVELV